MRIYIKEKSGRVIWLALPTRLILNKIVAGILVKALRTKVDLEKFNISAEDIGTIFKALLKTKKNFPGLELVDITSAEGDVVKIRL